MTTTSFVKNVAELLDLSACAGDFVGDYDMDAVRSDFLARLNVNAPAGIFILANGDVIAELNMRGIAHEIHWKELADGIDVEPIFERHDKHRHQEAVTRDANGITAVRCYSCGQPMRGSSKTRSLLVQTLLGELREEGMTTYFDADGESRSLTEPRPVPVGPPHGAICTHCGWCAERCHALPSGSQCCALCGHAATEIAELEEE